MEFLRKYHKLLIIIIVVTLFAYFNPFLLEKRSQKRLYENGFSAVVINKYFTIKESQRRIIILNECETHKEFKFFTLNNNEEIFDVVEIGDTIIKIPDTFEIIIRNDTKDIRTSIQESKGTKFKTL